MNLNFNNDGYFTIPLWGDLRIIVNETLISMWIVGAVLIIFAIIVRIKSGKKCKNFKEIPATKFQNIIEIMVETFDGIVTDTMSRKYAWVGNWFFGVFAFIWIGNLSGLLGLRAPTTDLAVTFAMGISTVVLMQFCGIVYSKGEYWKSFIKPVPIFLPLNVLSEVSKSISLSSRLFGNMLGGTIVMTLVYALPWFVRIGPPGALSLYMDIFAGTLQAYVFLMLSLNFIRSKAPEEE